MNIFKPDIPLNPGDEKYWTNLHGASIGLSVSSIIAQSSRPVLIIAQDSLMASHLADEIQFFDTTGNTILPFPDWETLPYDHFSPHQDIISDRLAALCKIPSMTSGAIITTISTLLHRIAPQPYLDAHTFLLSTGEPLNIDILRTRLTSAGYQLVSQVREHGEFAIRGSIIDIFPMGSHQPFRIDLFDNEIDSIRLFSPENQRSLDKVDVINLLPAKEFPLTDESIEQFRSGWRNQFSGNPLKCPIYQDVSDGICAPGIEYYLPLFFDKTAVLFDYLPKNTLIVTVGDVISQISEFWDEIKLRYEQVKHDISKPVLPPEQLFIDKHAYLNAVQQEARVHIESDKNEYGLDFQTSKLPDIYVDHKSTHPLSLLENFIQTFHGRILFCVETAGRREVLLQLIKTIKLEPKQFHSWQEFLNSEDKIGMVISPIENGFILNHPNIAIITETQLYGKRVMQRRMRKKSIQDPESIVKDLTELQIGDPVVHIDHGIGRYLGLQTLTVGEQEAEFLCLEYQNNDKLYVPVAALNRVSRYTGTNPENSPISKLGTSQWARAKRKAAEKARDTAAELLDLYARRASRPGEACVIQPDQYEIFAAEFPFEETADQLQAIEQVFSDMTSDRPMDRVICGDVGFGKTEVALRAAFLAIQNNKQIAILVPTTLLAQQHFSLFQDRFADWPVKVEVLSRFRTGKQQAETLKRITEGKADIVIGTHKLLQSNIKFNNLGLVIVDEEQRFGVKQKEKLKALRSSVDMLTLTATPIPRTLNMSLAGIRDLSIIATPPAKRLSVKTFIHEYNDAIIQEAIQREILRGGQVYFLHNDISTINKKAEDIMKLAPDARVTIGHGQMHERELERVMSEFYHRRFNVLVCSTIIESGIDIPTANTIVINRADKFGIAQLHQLRGRVGRSHHQAYAYLFTPPKDLISADASKRLDAISTYDDLGIGFTLATHDLEIRGAGELLGEEQSGNMQEVGFTLYMDLLSRAVDALKNGKEPDMDNALLEHQSEIDLKLTALIPESYLGDVQLRLLFYKKIANAKSVAALDDIQVEMIDRFGLLPDQLKNLFAVTELKLQADNLGIVKIEASDLGGKVEFNDKPNIKPETIIKLIQDKSQRFRLDGAKKMKFMLVKHEKKDRIDLVKAVLEELGG